MPAQFKISGLHLISRMSNSSNGIGFVMTAAQANFANVLAEACPIPGTCVCFLVLVAYAVAACFPRARKHMDRVSFRLSIYTLIFNVLFGIAYAAMPSSPGLGCKVEAFCVNLFLTFSTFFTTCIAINLQLVVVHHIDGQRMEKYYLIGTTLLSIALNVPAFALNQFGWDEGSSTCWYKNSDPNVRLRWIIGTQSFWIVLSATVETICSCFVLAYMYIQRMNVKSVAFTASTPPQVENNSIRANTTHVANYRESMDITQAPRYRRAILRIVLYPIISLIMNYTTVVLDLHNVIQGVNTPLNFRLLILDHFLCGIRTLLYGLLAACDLSFTTALQEMLGRNKSKLEKQFTTIEFSAATPDQSDSHSQETVIVGTDMAQLRWNLDLTSSAKERTMNVVGVQVNVDAEQRLGVGQDLESGDVQYDCELEFPQIERQL